MTDQEKKSLRSFLKEMEDSLARWKDFDNGQPQRLYVAGRKDEVRQHISSFREMFAEDIFPTCEVCNKPVADEDKAKDVDAHQGCIKPCRHADDCPMDHCATGPNLRCFGYDKMLDEGE